MEETPKARNVGTYVTPFYFLIVFPELFVRLCEHTARKLTISLDATPFTYRRHVPRFLFSFPAPSIPLRAINHPPFRHFSFLWFIISSCNFRIAPRTPSLPQSFSRFWNDIFTSVSSPSPRSPFLPLLIISDVSSDIRFRLLFVSSSFVSCLSNTILMFQKFSLFFIIVL